jgi:hypothetical protein
MRSDSRATWEPSDVPGESEVCCADEEGVPDPAD